MKNYEFYLPKTMNEALELVHEYRNDCLIVAGGTDIVVELYEQKCCTGHVIAINKILELNKIRVEDGRVHIGALNTFANLEDSEYVRTYLKPLHDTARSMGSPQIRNLATIGGNVANASVAGDAPTTLIAYDASVVLRNIQGSRIMKLTDFYKGPGKCQLEKDEILTEIFFDEPNVNVAGAYMKVGKRKALAIADLGLAMIIRRREDNVCEQSRIVVGAISPHPVNVTEVEVTLKGNIINKENLFSTLPMFHDKVVECISHRPWELIYKKECILGAAKWCYEEILASFGLE